MDISRECRNAYSLELKVKQGNRFVCCGRQVLEVSRKPAEILLSLLLDTGEGAQRGVGFWQHHALRMLV